MRADARAEERACGEVGVQGVPVLCTAVQPDPARVLVPPASSPTTRVTRVCLCGQSFSKVLLAFAQMVFKGARGGGRCSSW